MSRFTSWILAVASVLLPVASFAQTTGGALTGEVEDAQGRAVRGATVEATNLEAGARFVATTNDSGVYRFSALPVGRYLVRFSHQGFQSAEIEGVELHVGQDRRADFRLAVAGQKDEITVSDSLSGLDVQTSASSRAVLAEEVQNLPLNGRQLQNLALLAPGIAAGWNWSTAANRYGKARENLEGAFNVNGARARSNNFTLDGITLNLRQYGVINFEPSVEAVEEFRLVSGTPAAEYGSTMGSAVTLVTRSGGEQYRGSLYEFFRNDRLDANDPFNKSAGLPRGKLRQNQFGGSLGGPIYKRSHFFFVNTEFLRIIEGVETRLTSVPTAEESRGLLRYRDSNGPRTLDLSSQITPTSQNLLGLFPQANTSGAQDLNYSSSLLIRLNDYQTHARTDHYLSSKDLLNVRFSWNLNDQEYVINRFGGPFIPGFSLPNPEKTTNAGAGYTRTIGPAMVNELRVGVNRYRNPLANGDQRSARNIGLPNGSVANGIPSVEFRGGTLESLGGLAWFNRDQNETTYQVSDSLSVLIGRHSLKFGGAVLRQHMNTRGAYNQRGTVRFDGTRNTLIPRLPGNERASLLADFLLGLPSEASITLGQFGRGFRQWNWSGFAQDSWRVTSRLTLNLGLRYDYTAPWTEVNSKLSNVFPGRGLVSAQDSAFPGLYPSDPNNFAPRLGFAYDIGGRGSTVVRGGFGFLYETLLQANSVELVENNAPFSSSAITRSPTPFSTGGSQSATLLDLAALATPSRSLGAIGSFRNPYTMQFSFGIQQRLASHWILEATYAGTRGLRLPVYRNGNQVPLESLTPSQRALIGGAAAAGQDTTPLLQPLRPYPEFDNITVSENIGSSTYHSGQVRLSRRFSSGLLLDTSYTFAKSIDNASDFNSGDPSEHVLNAYELSRQRGVSSFDIPHRLTSSVQYAVPVSSALNRSARAILSGWTLNGLITIQSGQPFTPFVPSFDPFRNEAFNRPNVAGDPNKGVPSGLAFNPSVFTVAAPGTFGNAGRNIVRGDSYRSFDLSVFRTFRFDERRSLQFRAEVMNALNTVNFQGPVTDLTAAPGAFVAAAPPRVVQLGLKFQF
ncbi:MAG: TonB-dependent receptor [Acidobacteria bacterium]|nr:TonB-dependent receptor [Acidobacteriota bacterium]